MPKLLGALIGLILGFLLGVFYETGMPKKEEPQPQIMIYLDESLCHKKPSI